MRIERAADATEVICRTFCVLRLKNEFGMINSRNTGAKGDIMDRTIYDNYVKILRKELVPALGCTEPIALTTMHRQKQGKCWESFQSI